MSDAAEALYHAAARQLCAKSCAGVLERIFRQAEKPICVCGEMGGDVAASLVLVGLGLRKLSMSGSAIATVKHALAGKSMEQLEIIAENILSMATATEAENYLKSQI